MLLEKLELIEVTYSDDMQKATLTFLDEERGEIREVNFNKAVWDDVESKFKPDVDKADKVEEWCKEYFDLSFNELTKAVGESRDVYAYDNFNSLWEVQMVKKFGEDMLNQIIECECTEVVDDGKAVKLRFEYDGDLYESKMSYAEYNEARKMWFVNPQKQARQYAKFEQKFHVPIEQRDNLVGKTLMIEIKKAMGKWIYAEVKAFPKRKKK